MTIDRQADPKGEPKDEPKGDRVKLAMTGKFLLRKRVRRGCATGEGLEPH
jgi:cyanate lyase